MDTETEAVDSTARARGPLVFISHDTRDAALAEAFSRLLSSVSAGVLKSFRSSDKTGNQGIEYGVEWFPEIMKKLESASDVVCLLTPNSVGRPWILYEAGVAKGKLDTPVHGVALGIPLQNATSGPFAQFQNSDDSEDALTQLVMQLVRRIPGAEPDREVVKMQVAAFREKALPMATADSAAPATPAEADAASVAKIFEEVKVMFQDLPMRIERRLDPEAPSIRRRGRISPRMMHEMLHITERDLPDGIQIVMIASQFRDDFPWLYELAVDAYRRISAKEPGAMEALSALEHLFHVSLRHPLFREMSMRSKDRYFSMDESLAILHETAERLRNRNIPRGIRLADAVLPSDDEDESEN